MEKGKLDTLGLCMKGYMLAWLKEQTDGLSIYTLSTYTLCDYVGMFSLACCLPETGENHGHADRQIDRQTCVTSSLDEQILRALIAV